MKHNAFGLILLMLLALSLTSLHAQAQTYIENTVYSFAGGTVDGSAPFSDLIDVNGTLYGTTTAGGSAKAGVVFAIDEKTQAESVIYSFTADQGSGGDPQAGLLNVNGILYGTTANFGANNYGTLFSLDPSTGDGATVYNFAGTSGLRDGANPYAGLIDVNGIFYGTTETGGIYGDGTAFSFDPSTNTEKNLCSFGASSTDGVYPTASLTSINGILYGTTYSGGYSGYGTVFSLDPLTKAKTILYYFNHGADGANPEGGLIAVNGKLYGTAQTGGTSTQGLQGTVYSIDPTTGDETTVYSFSGSQDGANSDADLILVNGKLFGTTLNGGAYNFGTVFSVDPATGAETIVYSFTDSTGDGAAPIGGLIDVNGTLYGTTNTGGTYGAGTVFSLTPAVPPTANTDGCTIAHDKARSNAAPGVLSNDINQGPGPMTAVLVSNVSHGTLILNSDGSFTYTPNTGYAGKDVFTYQAVNPVGKSNVTTCTFTVLAAAPTANTDGATIKINTARTFAAPGVLGNDLNGGEGPLTATLVSNVSHGTLALHSDGSFIYTPNTGYIGKDVFTYQAVNPVGKSNTTTCTLTVVSTPTAKNDGATIAHNTARTFAAPGVLSNDNNGGANPMTAALVTNVSHGTLTLHSDGSFIYTPKTGYSGTDTFTYRVSNPIGPGTIGTVTLTVQ